VFDPQPIRRLTPTGDAGQIMELGRQLQELATVHGIHNVMTDNGYQELVVLTLFGLTKMRREGNDARDAEGHEYELKTVGRISADGVLKKTLSITTEHTLTHANIARYRGVWLWVVAVFNRTLPEVIYEITPQALEPFFAAWETRLREQDPTGTDALNHMNNPKIPLKFVAQRGIRIWPPETPAV
jgi:Restriction endonuclease PvuII